LEILAIRPDTRGGNAIATFDAQLTPNIRMFGLKLVQTPRGHRVYPPHTNVHNCATFAPEFAKAIIRAALAALATGENRDADRAV